MRISDWSSDVCSSDLAVPVALRGGRAWRQAYQVHAEGIEAQRIAQRPLLPLAAGRAPGLRIGRAFADLDSRRIERGNRGALGHAVSSCRRRSEEHTSELQSLMRISYAVFCLKKKKTKKRDEKTNDTKDRETKQKQNTS